MAFMGGSANAMANSLMEGYILPTPVNLKRLTLDELRALLFEIEKLLREHRSMIPDQSNPLSLQKRNQHILKLSQTRTVLANAVQLKARGRL